jgi:DNA polymerase III delta prime subunit
MDEQQQDVPSPVKVFYSYAHEDEALCQELEKHLSLLQRQGLVTGWSDRQITPGKNWEEAIDERLMTASVILLLISPDFLASDYCYGIEMQQALERHRVKEACVIPVLLRPVDWQGAPFAHLQCLPRNGKSVTEWSNRDAAFRDVARGIRLAIEHLQSPSRSTTRPFATPAVSQKKLQNRQRFLKRIHDFWIAGVLEQSLHGIPAMSLELQEQPDALERSWESTIGESDRPAQPLPAGTPIMQVYDEADGELLILGAPGTGKTTLLLEIARDLIDRAKLDASHSIPVVFNLSSWAVKRQRLDLWLVEELNTKYQVPRQLGQSWVNNLQILPLLDGLDEMTPPVREECVKAINLYRQEYYILPMVVCCRSDDFFAIETPLRLYRAVTVQPLTPQQVDQYLARGGEPLATVRLALDTDAVLRELAITPLMLNVLIVAYQDQSTANPPTEASPQDRRRQLFSSYVQRMLQRRGKDPHYHPRQTIDWLSWLANQLLLHNQTEFSLERLQPDWLSKQRVRWFYYLLVKLTVGLIAGLIFAVVFGLAYGIARGPIVGLVVGLIIGLVYGIIYGLIYGLDELLVGGLIIGLFVTLLGDLLERLLVPRTSAAQPTLGFAWSWQKMRRGILIGLVYGVIYALIVLLFFYPLTYSLIWGMAIWLIYTLMAGFAPKRMMEIKPAEVLTWSWQQMGRGLIRGLPFGLVISLIFAIIAQSTTYGLVVGGISVLVIAVITGLSGATLSEQTHIKPNQGIWRSLRHGLLLAVSLTLVVALLVGQVTGLFTEPFYALFWGLFFGLLVGLQYGGIAFIQHAVLRLFLWRSKAVPWNYPRFLDYAAERILLRRVGGNYIFGHRMLVEYFASLYAASEDKQTNAQAVHESSGLGTQAE